MTSKKKDPWRSLAAQLGLASSEPAETEETTSPTEVPSAASDTTSELIVTTAEPFPIESPAEQAVVSPEPAAAPPKPAPVRKKRDHWGSVLGLLGLQGSAEPEEPEPAESAEASVSEPIAPPPAPPSRPVPPSRSPRKGPSSGRGASRERKPFGQLDDAQQREEPVVEEPRFEPPVVDEAEPVVEDASHRERAREAFDSLFSDLPTSDREAGPTEDDLEKGLREFWNEELSAESKPLIPSLPPVHPRRERSWDIEEIDVDAEIEQDERESPRGGESSESRDELGRKRRRRRRRGRGRGREEGSVDRPTTGRESPDPDDIDFEDAEDISLDEPRSARGTRPFREPEFGDDLDPDERPQRRTAEPSVRRERSEGPRSEEEGDEESGKRRRRRRRRRPSSDVESTKDVESRDDDDFDLSDEDADDAVAAYRGSDREGHKRIPTWLEAVNLLIDQNMSARKSQPQQSHRGGGNRDRGGRGGRGRR